MFDLRLYDYNKVQEFLDKNIAKRNIKPCVSIENIENTDTGSNLNFNYKLIVVSIDYEYFDDPDKSFRMNDVLYEKSYYYILDYNDESFENELSVLDCGGYFIAVCIFKNNVNVTNDYIYNKEIDKDNTFQKFHMNTKIGTKNEIINTK
jgi:hypothetical protein